MYKVTTVTRSGYVSIGFMTERQLKECILEIVEAVKIDIPA